MVRLQTRTRSPSRVTVNDVLDGLDQEYQMQGRKSVVEMRYHCKPLRDHLGRYPAATLTTAQIRTYVVRRQQLGRANGTINRELSALKTAYTLAYQDGVVPAIPYGPRLRETTIRQGTFSETDIQRICAALPAHLQPVVWFAYYTGRRRGEILQLQWEDIQWTSHGGMIVIRASTTKTGEPDRIPLVGGLRDLMDALRKTRGTTPSPYVFTYQGKPFKTFSNTWKRTLTGLGMPDKLFHDLRRTASTDLCEAGVPEAVAMRITGHRSTTTYRRYNIVQSKTVAQGLHQLDAYRQGEDLWPKSP